MTPSMPIATDNIYKFATLFGLAIIISVILIGGYMQDKYGELLFNKDLELRILNSKETPSTEETIKMGLLQEYEKAFSSNLLAILYTSVVFALIGIFLFLWGWICWWWKVQPKQDELFHLQIEKTRREIQVLNKQLELK